MCVCVYIHTQSKSFLSPDYSMLILGRDFKPTLMILDCQQNVYDGEQGFSGDFSFRYNIHSTQ